MIVVAIIGLLAAIAIPNFVKARTTSQQNACINNLRLIDASKQQWALEQKKQPPTRRKARICSPTWAAAPTVNCRPARLIRRTHSPPATRLTTLARPRCARLCPPRTCCHNVLNLSRPRRVVTRERPGLTPGLPFWPHPPRNLLAQTNSLLLWFLALVRPMWRNWQTR
jgi:hypothetical protein